MRHNDDGRISFVNEGAAVVATAPRASKTAIRRPRLPHAAGQIHSGHARFSCASINVSASSLTAMQRRWRTRRTLLCTLIDSTLLDRVSPPPSLVKGNHALRPSISTMWCVSDAIHTRRVDP
uniref:Uncharacterized protein n=1 Tax=Plectus sambesii TaxID=2011161 RepID=A0A914XHW7_9BILA